MPMKERLKNHGRKFSNAFRGPRNPDKLSLGDFFFDPNISLPTSDSSASNSSAGSSRESTLSHSRLPRENKPGLQAISNEQRGIPPPLPTRNPNRLRHRRRDTSPGRPPPEGLGPLLVRSATDPNSFELEQSFLPPIPEVNPSHWQLRHPRPSPAGAVQQHFRDNGLVVPGTVTGSDQYSYSSKRDRSYQSHRQLETSPARTSQILPHGIGDIIRRSASVSKSFHSDQFDEARDLDSARHSRYKISPVDTQTPLQACPRLLASSVFDSSPGSSLLSLGLEQTDQATSDQPLNLLVHPRMAAMRASAFLDIYSTHLSRLPESQRFTRNEAKKQEAVIHAKLKSAGEPIPPYEFQNFIGKGSYGRVYLARDRRNDHRVALKISDIDAQDYKVDPSQRNANLEAVMHEYKVLKQLEGAERVNQIYEILDVHSQVWIAAEYCPGGSVHTIMQAMNNRIEEKYIIPIARELAKGLKAVHDADIIHRDIKSANVMILENGDIQIIDFGVAGILETKSDRRNTVIGTPHWMGPELLPDLSHPDPRKQHGKEVDIWSYGCTLFEMATGNAPNARIPAAHLNKHLHMRGPPKLKVENGYSQELSDFIAFTMQLEPGNRPTMDAILEHPYIRDSEKDYPTSSLVDLIKEFERWAYAGGQRSSLISPYGAEGAEFHIESETKTEWRFSTLESTEILEEMSSDSSFDLSDAGNKATATSHLPTVHIDPITDISLAQAQEDSLNSYFEGEPPDGYLDEDLADEIYKPMSSPQPVVDAKFAPNEARVRRGANHLGPLFGQNIYEPEPSDSYLRSSDLPLRSQINVNTRQDADVSTGGSSKSGRNLANIDTMRANSYNARPPTMNFGWEFPGKASVGADAHGENHPNLKIWTPDSSLDYGAPSDDFESSQDEEPYIPPSRPALRHAATEPVHMNDSSALNPMDASRGSRLDMDALMGTFSVSSGLYATPAADHYNQDHQLGAPTADIGPDDESIDLDAMMSGSDVASFDDAYADHGDTPRDQHISHLAAEHYDSIEGHLGIVPVPQPPSQEAMTAGAPRIVLEMEVGRFAEAFRSGLGILSQQFESLVEEETPPAPTNGEEKTAPIGSE